MAASVDDPWSWREPSGVEELLTSVSTAWWVSGGWAIDLWLGRWTRNHDDFDIGCPEPGAQSLLDSLSGWDAYRAHHGVITYLPSRRAPATGGIWLRRVGTTAWDLQLMPEFTVAGEWVCRRDPLVRRPASESTWRTPGGLSVLCPEVQLLYKAKDVRPKDQHDFDVVLPTLGPDRRAWLAHGLRTLHPSHQWIDRVG